MNDNENEIYKIYQEQINDRDKIIYYLIDKSEKENEKNRKFVLIIIGIIAIIFTVAITSYFFAPYYTESKTEMEMKE